MPFKTLQQLITDVETALYQSAGPQVQIYSQDILAQMVQDAFNHVFMKRFWHYFRKREERTLDGTTGKITVVPTYITNYEDVQHVFRENSRRPLPVLPGHYNTLGMTGTTPRFIEASGDSKLIVVYPLTATGKVLIVGRRRPAAYAMDDEVEFDDVCIKHFAAWSYFNGDGSNPAEAAKHLALFEARLATLEQADQQHAVILDPHSTEVPTDWYQS